MDWSGLLNNWYAWLGWLNGSLALPIQDVSDRLNMPLVSAFLFGLLGTTAPCQLSTNFGALAFLGRHPADRRGTTTAGLAYLLAKILVYTLLGLVVLLVGRQLSQALIPYLALIRKLVGPGMILLGLAVLGAIRVRAQIGARAGAWLEAQAQAGGAQAPGPRAGFLLGLAFSCAFCPTLFLLFFGVTMTLAARSAGGLAFPAVFAVGTTLPLLALLALTITGAPAATRLRRTIRRANRPLRWLGAAVLILLGLHDTLIYWLV